MAETNNEINNVLYENVCKVLDKLQVSYQRRDNFLLTFGFKGEDMNHELLIKINTKKEVIMLMERLPFDILPEKSTEIACATCYANSTMLVGHFTYDMKQSLYFDVTQIFAGSLVGEETIFGMLSALISTVEEFDDKFMGLNKGYITLDSFKPAESN